MNKILFLILISVFSCTSKTPNTEYYKNDIAKAKQIAAKIKCNTDYLFVIDYSIHSGLERGFLINMKTNSIEKSFLVAHGSGMGEKNGKPKGFSNEVGSNASSLGFALLNGRDYSQYGVHIKYWLDGLENTNSNLKKRVVVLHSWGGIPEFSPYPVPIIQSQGCPTVSDKTMLFIDDFIKSQGNKKILMSFKNG